MDVIIYISIFLDQSKDRKDIVESQKLVQIGGRKIEINIEI